MSVYTQAPAASAATLNLAGGGIFSLKTGDGGGSGVQVSGIQALTLPIPGRSPLANFPFRVTALVTATYPSGTYTLRQTYAMLILPAPSVTINGQKLYTSVTPSDWIKPRVAVTASSLTSNVITITAPGHNFVTGDVVAVGGISNANIDLGMSSGIITGTTASTFTVALTHADLGNQNETTAWAQGFLTGTVKAASGAVNITATGTAPSPATGRFESFSTDLLNAGTLTSAYPGLTLSGAGAPETAAQLCLIASVTVTSGTLPSPVSFALKSFAVVED